jgi:Tfp pilus assembly protein PilF
MRVREILELVMRFTLPACGVALALLCVSSVSMGQRRDDDIDKRSAALVQEGKAKLDAGKFVEATDILETALAVDPRNRGAIVLLAKSAEGQGLPGKAIRLYREALLIEPNDVAVLAGQGAVLVKKGAFAKAQDNLARITKICATSCTEQVTLAKLIENGSKAPVVSAEAVQPKPVVTQN